MRSPLLNRHALYLSHPVDTHVEERQDCQIVEDLHQRIVNGGRNHEEYQVREYGHFSDRKQISTYADDCRQTEFEQDVRPVEQHAYQQFSAYKPIFKNTEYVIKPVEIRPFAIIGFNLLNLLKTFLNLLGDTALHNIMRGKRLVHRFLGKEDKQSRHRSHPKQGQSQSPVVEKQSGGNQYAYHRSEKLRNGMREKSLKGSTIFHHGGSEVGKILLAEESQRQLTQFFGDGDTQIGTFGIHLGVGSRILKQGDYVNHRHKDEGHRHIVPKAVGYGSSGTHHWTEIFRKEQENKNGGQQHSDVEQRSQQDAAEKGLRSFFG